jgi:hypothetical protein
MRSQALISPTNRYCKRKAFWRKLAQAVAFRRVRWMPFTLSELADRVYTSARFARPTRRRLNEATGYQGRSKGRVGRGGSATPASGFTDAVYGPDVTDRVAANVATHPSR